jgi:glyoxylase-like metal-dependent hydrolase (beta-lactamase superfamily II)
MKLIICETCGTQYREEVQFTGVCPICNDDRQYIGDNGQRWTDTDELKKGHKVKISQVNERLYTLKMETAFALGQRAFLVLSPNGNVLWDCIPLLDDATIDFINSKGGLKAIVFSHPHYYSTMNEWAAAFNCPIYIHQGDREFIFYSTDAVKLWEGDLQPLWDDLSIIHIGGHFPGSCLLRAGTLSSKGAILVGDSFYLSKSKRHIAVMYSYPNQILLTKKEFAEVRRKSAGLTFDTLYCAFDGQNLEGNAYEVFSTSIQRYLDSYEI